MASVLAACHLDLLGAGGYHQVTGYRRWHGRLLLYPGSSIRSRRRARLEARLEPAAEGMTAVSAARAEGLGLLSTRYLSIARWIVKDVRPASSLDSRDPLECGQDTPGGGACQTNS